jgi:hypothetical protein
MLFAEGQGQRAHPETEPNAIFNPGEGVPRSPDRTRGSGALNRPSGESGPFKPYNAKTPAYTGPRRMVSPAPV